VAGETVNSIGGWASAIVLWGFAAYRFGAGPDALAVTIVCWAVPPAVLSPLMGVYVDRFGPRAALVAGYCGAACCALAMAASGSLAELDAAAAARQDAGTGWFRELSQGIGLVARQRAARLVVLLSAAFTFTSASFLVVEPLYARHVLHRPPSQFALFEAAAGAGAILTGLAISRFRGGLSRLAGGRSWLRAPSATAWPRACSPGPRRCLLPTPEPWCGEPPERCSARSRSPGSSR